MEVLVAVDEAHLDALLQHVPARKVDFSDAVAVCREIQKRDEPHLAAYIAGAKSMAREGEIEVDDGAIVSAGDDPGAYVMAWLWVGNEDAEPPIKDADEDEA